MNSFLLNIMIIYYIILLFYIIYLIYLKFIKKENRMENLLKNNPDLLDEYKNINKQHSMVFIIGIIIGLIVLIYCEPTNITKIYKPIINAINDIKVI